MGPKRLVLEGDCADDLEEWGADIDAETAKRAGISKAPPPLPSLPKAVGSKGFARVVKSMDKPEKDVADDCNELLNDKITKSSSTKSLDLNEQIKNAKEAAARNADALEVSEELSLEAIVARLRTLPVQESAHKWDKAAIIRVLEALEKIPLTVDDLRDTQLGLLTQPYKDS